MNFECECFSTSSFSLGVGINRSTNSEELLEPPPYSENRK
jgi:hypothetical protein